MRVLRVLELSDGTARDRFHVTDSPIESRCTVSGWNSGAANARNISEVWRSLKEIKLKKHKTIINHEIRDATQSQASVTLWRSGATIHMYVQDLSVPHQLSSMKQFGEPDFDQNVRKFLTFAANPQGKVSHSNGLRISFQNKVNRECLLGCTCHAANWHHIAILR